MPVMTGASGHLTNASFIFSAGKTTIKIIVGLNHHHKKKEERKIK